MRSLNQEEIAVIKEDLKRMGLNLHVLQDEILDHICCMLEEELNNGVLLPAAKTKVYKIFNQDELNTTQQSTKKTLKSFRLKRKLRNITSVAACLMLLMVLGVEARDQVSEIEPFNPPSQDHIENNTINTDSTNVVKSIEPNTNPMNTSIF